MKWIYSKSRLRKYIRRVYKRKKAKDITIESLLGRDTIQLLDEKVRTKIEGRIILVTGAAGSIGSDICRQLCKYKIKKLILLDQSETGLHDILMELDKLSIDIELRAELASIRDSNRINNIFEKHRPEYVYHAAAYKHVPILEEYPSEVVMTNVYGTYLLANAAKRYNVEKFVMISTDKAVNPTNLMGACKRIGEIYIQSLSKAGGTQFITTRFGNVLGSNGSVIPTFKQQIELGGPVTVTHPDITRYFMTISEASSLVIEASVMGNGSEIFVFDMGNPIKILYLAHKMIQLSGYIPDTDIPVKFTNLRAGEKMYEELFNTSEKLLTTHHPKIMKACSSNIAVWFLTELEHLIKAATDCNDGVIRELIATIVPEYTAYTHHSTYN